MAITDNKLNHYIERIEGRHAPITADIFLTDYCNNKCSYCRYNHKSGNYMSFSDFKSYIAILHYMGVKGFILTGGGEPTINPHFDEMTAFLEENRLSYGLNTNFNEYRECAPVFLKISFDAASPEEYIERRGVDAFDKVIENIIRAVESKREKKKDTRIGVQCLADSVDGVRGFYRVVRDLGADYIYYRPLENIEGKRTAPEILTEIDRIAKKDARVVKSFKFQMEGIRFPSCIANWTAISLRHDGAVLYCCNKPDEIVGHITEPDILEKRENFFTNMSGCEIPCRLSGANNFLQFYKTEGSDRYFI